MTDEKRAEEYSKGKAAEHYNFLFEEHAGSPVDFARLCYLDGLKDGRTINCHTCMYGSTTGDCELGDDDCKDYEKWN